MPPTDPLDDVREWTADDIDIEGDYSAPSDWVWGMGFEDGLTSRPKGKFTTSYDNLDNLRRNHAVDNQHGRDC